MFCRLSRIQGEGGQEGGGGRGQKQNVLNIDQTTKISVSDTQHLLNQLHAPP